MTDEACSVLFHAMPLHDLGKLAVPSVILRKDGGLTAEEIVQVHEHAGIGEAVLSGSSSEFMRTAATIAGGHHEKFDGSGYPRRIAGDTIPLVARIAAVVDVFDSLTSARPRRIAWSVDRARTYLSAAASKHLDPTCVGAFLSSWSAVLDVRETFPGFALFPMQETC
jgi:putative two-component system response regulator